MIQLSKVKEIREISTKDNKGYANQINELLAKKNWAIYTILSREYESIFIMVRSED